MQSLQGDQAAAGRQELAGKAALVASVGGQRGFADWTNPDHRLRRLLAEFIGMAGLTFVLSGGAAILARYGGRGLQPWQTVLVLSAVSALWLVVAVYFLGDISAHFNPATTLAFALRLHAAMILADTAPVLSRGHRAQPRVRLVRNPAVRRLQAAIIPAARAAARQRTGSPFTRSFPRPFARPLR